MAVNVFLKLSGPDIAGESTDASHPGEIPVLSWSHSFNQPVPPGAVGGKASHSDFTFSKYLDTATPALLEHCWSGAPIEKAVITCYRSDGDNAAVLYLRIELESVIVSNVSIGGGQGDLPTENISLAYARLTYAYMPTGGTEIAASETRG